MLDIAPCLKVCVARGDDTGQPGDGQGDTALVLLGVLLDESVNEGASRSDHSHVLVVEKMNDPAGPFS